MAQTHRSMAYFPALTGRDEMSKQARFVIRMALACHEAGTPYDVQWKYRWEEPVEDKAVYVRPSDRPEPEHMPGCSIRRWYAVLTATGDIPMPKPFPKAPKARTMAATWKPNIFAEASYRTNVGKDKDGKDQSGWIIEHSSGLSLVKFGQSDTGELKADEDCDPMDGWRLTHTQSLLGFGIIGKFSRMVTALCFTEPLTDWTASVEELGKLPTFKRIGLMVEAEYGNASQRKYAADTLKRMGGPIERPTEPPPPTPAVAVRTRTTKPVDAVSKLAANEARIAAIKAQLAKPADDVQARLARLLAELRASRPQAPEGKLAVTYPDGRVAYIPDPTAERRASA